MPVIFDRRVNPETFLEFVRVFNDMDNYVRDFEYDDPNSLNNFKERILNDLNDPNIIINKIIANPVRENRNTGEISGGSVSVDIINNNIQITVSPNVQLNGIKLRHSLTPISNGFHDTEGEISYNRAISRQRSESFEHYQLNR